MTRPPGPSHVPEINEVETENPGKFPGQDVSTMPRVPIYARGRSSDGQMLVLGLLIILGLIACFK